jgi:hypothetical protein
MQISPTKIVKSHLNEYSLERSQGTLSGGICMISFIIELPSWDHLKHIHPIKMYLMTTKKCVKRCLVWHPHSNFDVAIRKSRPLTTNCGNRRPAIPLFKDQLSVRLIQAVLIPSYLCWLKSRPLYVYCAMWWGVCTIWQSRIWAWNQNTCSKIFIFQPILEFQKHFHYTEVNAVKLSTFQWPHNLRNTFFQI